MQLYELVKDKSYLQNKLDVNERLKQFKVPSFNAGASISTFLNRYDPIREKFSGFICENVDIHNLVPDAGVDWWHAQLLTNTAAGTRGSNYIALSQSTANPNDTWTTLTGEIVDGNGLARAVASPAASHVVGTNVSVVEKTFTATGNYSTGVRLVGLFNASTVGILNHVGILDKVTIVPSGSQFRTLCTLTFP